MSTDPLGPIAAWPRSLGCRTSRNDAGSFIQTGYMMIRWLLQSATVAQPFFRQLEPRSFNVVVPLDEAQFDSSQAGFQPNATRRRDVLCLIQSFQ